MHYWCILCIIVNKDNTDLQWRPRLKLLWQQKTASKSASVFEKCLVSSQMPASHAHTWIKRLCANSSRWRFPRPVSETDAESLRGPKLIKSLIADCKYSMWDSCRRGCVPCLKQGWLLIIPGICCPSLARFYGLCLSHHRPVVLPLYIVDPVNLHSTLWLNSLFFFWFQLCFCHTSSYK